MQMMAGRRTQAVEGAEAEGERVGEVGAVAAVGLRDASTVQRGRPPNQRAQAVP